METDDEKQQEAEWQTLNDRIAEMLDRFGTRNPIRKGDYWLVDENLGPRRQELEFQNLRLFRPDIIAALQGLLSDYPRWHITVRVDVPGTEEKWPGMGVIIYRDQIVDELQRQYFPEEFRGFSYPGSKRAFN